MRKAEVPFVGIDKWKKEASYFKDVYDPNSGLNCSRFVCRHCGEPSWFPDNEKTWFKYCPHCGVEKEMKKNGK